MQKRILEDTTKVKDIFATRFFAMRDHEKTTLSQVDLAAVR